MTRLPTIAVTGTNGKTTTTSMLAAITAAAGRPAFRMTTLGAFVGDEARSAGTDMTSFLALADTARAEGVDIATLEVTSRALANGFADRWPPDVAVLTGFSRDHLDRHATAEDYLAAKARLFLALGREGTAVLPAADPAGALIAEALDAIPPHDGGERRVLRFSLEPEGLGPFEARRFSSDASVDLQGRIEEVSLDGTTLRLSGGVLQETIRLTTVGAPFALDATAAALAAHAFGFEPAVIVRGLESFRGVAGRFERVARDPAVVVDYAHTPDALEALLHTARRVVAGRVILVFGCGGVRDRGKRALMGEVATRIADEVWLTTDNPRHEDPAVIAAEVRAGSAGADWREEPNRGKAIADAIGAARSDDIVVVAGKGHEKVQIIGNAEIAFDDVMVARSAWLGRV